MEHITDHNIEGRSIKIFTLNCWGLRFVSQHRQLRIKSIAQHLNEHDYDIVFLQEIWCQSDYDHIRETTKSKYRFCHMFRNQSVLGTSGLVVLISWIPNAIHFEPFAVNGSPFRPWHGDWFAFKGIGYVRVDLNKISLHLFCTHMHAQYSPNEDIYDKYSVHRICQSYQLSRFINLMTKNCPKNRTNMIILAGDLNAASNELPYKIIVQLTDLKDCYHPLLKSAKESVDDAIGDVQTIPNIRLNDDGDELDLEHYENPDRITSGHHKNSFTSIDSKGTKSYEYKRIDYIMYQLLPFQCGKSKNVKTKQEIGKEELIDEHKLCIVERFRCASKDPATGISFSDHQPVAVKLELNIDSAIKKTKTYVCSSCETNFKCTIDGQKENVSKSHITLGCDGDAATNSNVNSKSSNGLTACNGIDNILSSDAHDLADDSDESTELLYDKTKNKYLLSETTDSGAKMTKSGPLQLKQIASNIVMRSNSSMKEDSTKLNLLERVNTLLYDYLEINRQSMNRTLFLFVFALLLMLSFSIIAIIFFMISVLTLVFIELTMLTIGFFSIFLMQLLYRCEHNAIKAIINDINSEIILSNNFK